MPSFEVYLKGGAPWGFRLAGGREFGMPLHISKVVPSGKADAAGLKVGDEILEINGKDIGKVYHTEALVFIKKAVNELRMVLDRPETFSHEMEGGDYKQDRKYSNTDPPSYNDTHNYRPKSDEYANKGRHNSEWSPDIISDVTRIPDPIAIETGGGQYATDEPPDGYNDPDYRQSYTSSLPRSLGKKTRTMDQNRSATLPRNMKPDEKGKQAVPSWYKEMQKEINKSMEGQSHLGRLLTADAAKGAFRHYDGASSPRNLSPNSSQRRQRPKSIHVDRFQFEDFSASQGATTKDDMSRDTARSNLEKREKRHSVHSNWYREFQKGGEIPAAGLAAEPGDASAIKPVHARSRSSDDILSSSKGMPYQAPDQRSSETRMTNPAKFEYNNPPDFLELRKKAEAEGALREERERELRMLQEERRKWLEEEEKLKAVNYDARKKAEEERREQARLREEQMRIQRERDMRLQKEREAQLQKEREAQRALEIEENNRRKMEAVVQQKNAKNEVMGQARAIYTFRSQSQAELSFKKGQVFNVFKQIDENWYEGEIDGQIGIFPVNYVELIETEEEPPQEPEDAGTIQIEEGLAKARYKFQAENDKEISFTKNDMITLLRKLDDNWYEGEIGDQIGIFPVNYVDVLREPRIIKNDAPPSMSSNLVKKVEKPQQITREERTESHPANYRNEEKAHPAQKAPQNIHNGNVSNSISEPANPRPIHDKRNGERNRAIYSYAPMNEDEIELIEGDTVFVLEKCDDGWFVGICERTGKFGTFPGNYVVVA